MKNAWERLGCMASLLWPKASSNLPPLPLFSVLKVAPSDNDALAVKATLLIELGSFEDALKVIDAAPSTISSRMAFERAYCTYRLGKLEGALEALSSIDEERAAAVLQLEAQIQYRMGNYSKCIDIYTKLLREYGEDSIEVKTNVVAAYAAAGRGDEIAQVISQDLGASLEQGFELAFNAACGNIEAGKLPESVEQLQLARRVGEEMLYEEELEEDDVEAELAPIAAQIAYTTAVEGNLDEAVEAFRDLGALEGSDPLTGIVSASNLAALLLLKEKPDNRKATMEGLKGLEPFLERSGGYVKIKSAIEGRIGTVYCETILAIYASAALRSGKVDVAREAIRSIERYKKGSLLAAVVLASLLARENKLKEASGVLDNSMKNLQGETNSPTFIQAILLRAQLAVALGDNARAVECLKAMSSEFRDRPAALATRVSLMESQGDVENAVALLKDIMNLDSLTAPGARWVLMRLAMLEANRGDLDAATAYLMQLRNAYPTCMEDPDVLRKLPRFLAATHPSKSSELLGSLPSPPALGNSELDALETAGATGAGTSVEQKMDERGLIAKKGEERTEEPSESSKQESEKKRKRKRKPRYPKNFDPERPGPPPDPERWLPKWQRSTYKKKRKGKDRDVVKGSQGAGRVDAALDRTAVKQQQSSSSTKSQASGKKKKKGKGRR